MIVLGIDPGLTKKNPTGLAIVSTYNMSLFATRTAYAPQSVDWVRRLELAIKAMQKIVYEYPEIELVAYEYPFTGQNSQSTIKLAHVCGAAYALGKPCQMVYPVQAKIALTSDKGASKEAMVKMAKQIFPAIEISKDEADAIGIALAGEAEYRRNAF